MTPQYSLRPTPQPDESDWARQIEQTISNYQARDLEQHSGGVRRVAAGERVFGFDPQRTLERIARVTERPNLPYHILLLQDNDPNAASLADGRVYITTGMLQYLASRGSNDNELAMILGHELAHTVAQHLVKRYEQVQKEQMMLTLVGLGTAAVTRGGGERAQQLASLAKNVAGLVAQVAASGYSQDQELEADQLGARYMITAGYDPVPALAMLEDFARFDQPSIPFLRTHPVTERRVEDLRRYLIETGHLRGTVMPSTSALPDASSFKPATAPADRAAARKRLLDTQTLYPRGSQSWKNLQQQIDALQ